MSGVGFPDVRYGEQGKNPKNFQINLSKTPASGVYAKTGEKIRSGLFPGSGENLSTCSPKLGSRIIITRIGGNSKPGNRLSLNFEQNPKTIEGVFPKIMENPFSEIIFISGNEYSRKKEKGLF